MAIPPKPDDDGDLPGVANPEVFYEFMGDLAQEANLTTKQYEAGINAAGIFEPIAAQGNKGTVARLKVARAAKEGRFDWVTGRITD